MAEEIIFGDITTGASNDIKRATETARSMVMKYGMSEKIGLIAYGNDDDEVFIGRDLAHTRGYSEEVAREIDGEISRIIRECHENAESIIRENIGVLHSCAALLLEKEKIHREEFEALFYNRKRRGCKNKRIKCTKKILNFVNFVHTFWWTHGTINTVKTPQYII